MKKQILVMSIVALFSGSVLAANQGVVGATTSSGDLSVTLTVSNFIQVNGLNDVALGTYTGLALPAVSEDFCVRSNTPTFTLTLDDSIDPTGFYLQEDAGSGKILYTVDISTVTTSNIPTLVGQAGHGVDNPGIAEQRTESSCSSGDNVRLTFQADESGVEGMIAAAAGTYTGVLNVTVAPE